MGHESYQRQEDIHGPSNRSFGLVFAAVFGLIGVFSLPFGGGLRTWALVVGAAFLLAAYAAPSILAPLNRLWLRFGLLLHKIVSPVALGIMFFGVITPIGLVMRAFGKVPLRLTYEHQSPSYWIDRSPPGPPPESLKDQF